MKRPTKREIALSLHEVGRPADEIARALSMSRAAVRRAIDDARRQRDAREVAAMYEGRRVMPEAR